MRPKDLNLEGLVVWMGAPRGMATQYKNGIDSLPTPSLSF